MPLEVALWRVDTDQPVRLQPSGVPLESQLEVMIEADPTILGTPLLLIGRQVTTDYGKFIDLLAVDDEGALHVLELKRDRTPREVVAQLLDYGSWIQSLTDPQVRAIYANYRAGQSIEQGWSDIFGGSPPDELNTSHRLTVVAADIDPSTERIVEYLSGMDVPINVVFFRYFSEDGRAYLARTWLIDEARVTAKATAKAQGTKEPWNELDWYVSYGEAPGSRNWEDARRYGFVSGGGGDWYSKTIRKLPEGARIFVCLPKAGYVGVGTVTGPARRAQEAKLFVDGLEQPMASLPLKGFYGAMEAEAPRDEAMDEWVVPVNWLTTRSRQDAVWERGMFANQSSACKLRNRFTLEQLVKAFDLDDGVID